MIYDMTSPTHFAAIAYLTMASVIGPIQYLLGHALVAHATEARA